MSSASAALQWLAIIQILLDSSTTINGHRHGPSTSSSTPLIRHHFGRIRAEELFTNQLQPSLFNWTNVGANAERYRYSASLSGRPDLPTWMRYMYSTEYSAGYLYGTPPARLIGHEVHLDLVALDERTYETRHVLVTYSVVAMKTMMQQSAIGGLIIALPPVMQAVHMRIDNLNWVNLMDPGRVENLKNIFRLDLWPESSDDLHVSFMDSAVSLGGRVPLRPQEKEGVVIHLASAAPLSGRLIDLQQEIRPLYKLSTCPYKRTSVQTAFETAGFKIDWCAFRVRDGQSKSSSAAVEKQLMRYQQHHDEQQQLHNDSEPNESASSTTPSSSSATFQTTIIGTVFHQPLDAYEPIPMLRSDAPQRNYIDEIALTACVPLLMFTLLVAVLTMIVCLDQGKIEYNNGGTAATTKSVQMVQYAGSTNAKFMTGNRDDVTGAMRSPAHLIQSRAALLLSDSVDNQSLRSAHNSSSPYASLPRLPNGTVSSTAQRSGGSGSPRLASNSTLRPRPPPYKPPNSAALPVVQRPTSGSSTSAGGGVGGSSTLLPIAVNVMPSLVTGGGSVIPQSSSSRVLYC